MTKPTGVIKVDVVCYENANMEETMIQVSERAEKAFLDYFKDKGSAAPIRVYLSEGG